MCECVCVSAERRNLHFELSWREQTELLQHTCWGNPHRSRDTDIFTNHIKLNQTVVLIDMSVCVCLWSLQELLLCPVWRIQEYVTLLQALTLHTPPAHPDHTHLSSALNTLQRYSGFIHKVGLYDLNMLHLLCQIINCNNWDHSFSSCSTRSVCPVFWVSILQLLKLLLNKNQLLLPKNKEVTPFCCFVQWIHSVFSFS